jgi:signal transduction histidine kinase
MAGRGTEGDQRVPAAIAGRSDIGGGAHDAPRPPANLEAVAEAFERFTRTTARMEESYRLLEARLQSLDRELQDKNRELTLATEYLNAVLNGMSDGVIATNSGGFVTTFNRAAATIRGRAPGEVLGRPHADLFGAGPAPGSGPRLRELETTGGAKVPVSERAAPIADRLGDRLGTVYVFQDLSEIEALREEVRRKDRLAALGQMAATVAHEIRNPLGGIQGFAALLERDIPPDDPRRRLVEKILAGTKSLDRVVNELLEYTRPVELNLETLDAHAIVAGAIEFLPRTPAGIAIHNRVPRGLTLRADAHKLRQVLLNVLLNALQSIEGAGEIEIAAETVPGKLILSVRDNGAGIPPEHLDKVFMPFFTTREKGTGLGLAAAAKIVESHGGNIDVDSKPGAGAAFRIRLPRPEPA